MSAAAFKKIVATTAVLNKTDIDTDQIIPAQYLRVTSKQGLGKFLFAGLRKRADGSLDADFVLNQPQGMQAQVLVAGDNFGCGSSREHAAWALVDAGFKAIISTRFADIFKNNAFKNGLLLMEVETQIHAQLCAAPFAQVEIDLENNTLVLPTGQKVAFVVEPFARYRLLAGIDELDFILQHQDAIAAYERKRTHACDTLDV